MQEEYVVLVDEADKVVGIREKMSVHRLGLLHRAFSIFIFNDHGELLLQQRAPGKYHSPNLWTNSCCGHPRPGEHIWNAAVRRLHEELGFTTSLTDQFSFIYKVSLDTLYEHELDHVYFGYYSGSINPDPDEVSGVKWLPPPGITKLLLLYPQSFTYWFRHIFSLPEFSEAMSTFRSLRT